MAADDVVSIQVHVNGETRMLVAGATVAHLLSELGLQGKPVAVERNQEVVPRAEHGTTKLADGDRLEVVTFVGGG
jgi:sulfur carrier protein